MDQQQILALIIFGITIIAIILDVFDTTVLALLGAAAMIFFKVIPIDNVMGYVSFNTLEVLVGMMLIVAVLKETGIFEFMATFTAKACKGNTFKILICLGIITAIFSAILDNVTTVLLMGPVTFYVTKKLKVNPIDGYERVALVRKHYPDLVLAADANRSYSYQEIDKVRQYDDLGLACIEEPFAMVNLQSYKDWKWESLNHGDWKIYTPICLDESILGYDDLSYAIEYGLIDVLNIKVGRMGGLIPTKAAINLCRERHIPYWIGSMVESGVSKMLHVQLAALGDSYMAGDLSDSNRYFEQDLIFPDLTFKDGVMQVPDGDGLGVTVFDDRLETYCMEKRTL